MKKWLMVVCLACPLFAAAFPAGEYLTDGGWGTLVLKQAAQGAQAFTIQAQGANGHQCDLSGDIRQGKAVLTEYQDVGSCTIRFNAKNGIIKVDPDLNDACHAYCGARAWFGGSYHIPVAGCDEKSQQKTRAAFKKLYDRKDYAAAVRTLAPLLQRCQRTQFWLTDLNIRNDLALAQAKQGDGAACRKALQPLLKDVAKYSDDSDYTQNKNVVCTNDERSLPPADCDAYMDIVRAAKTNLKWCDKAGK